ncbi:MAG: FliM/FliN family flagellar motor switch protein [Hyphomonas sp.]
MTRSAGAPRLVPSLSDSADEGWDMSPRRVGHVMNDLTDASAKADPERFLMTARGKLTPAEIEALLRPDLSDLAGDEPAGPVPLASADFAVPAASAPDRDLEISRRLAARLSLAMREGCGVQVAAIISEFRRTAFEAAVRRGNEERGQAIACFASRGGDISAMLILSPGFTQLLIDRACGGRERPGAVKPLSPIDIALLDALLRPLAQAISPELQFASLETDGVFAASIAPPSEALACELSMRGQAGAFRGQLIVSSAIADLQQDRPAQPAGPAAMPGAPLSGRGVLTVTLTARVASLAVPLSKLSGLKPGSTLLLGVPADQPVELMSGGTQGVMAAQAEIGRRGARVALRILRRGPALGPLSPAGS